MQRLAFARKEWRLAQFVIPITYPASTRYKSSNHSIWSQDFNIFPIQVGPKRKNGRILNK